MKLLRLDHVNVLTARLEGLVRFYEDLLGLRLGPRPDFPMAGAWLYLGDQAVIHLVEVSERRAAVNPRIEHFAFRAEGLSDLTNRLTAAGVPHSVDPVPGLPLVQVNLRDPDGNHIHVDFDTAGTATQD